MGAFPGPPKNPDWIIGDTDALIQLVACDMLGILRILKDRYGIRTLVPEPVEVELRNIGRNLKFRDTEHILTKGLTTGLLAILDEQSLRSVIGPTTSKIFEDIDRKGASFKRMGVGNGEAYAHAASAELNVPVLTNDGNAIRILRGKGATLPGPFLRSFDAIVFGRQIGHLTDRDCDSARQSLTKRGESITPCFQISSFTDGLPDFYQRLVDRTAPVCGSMTPLLHYDRHRVIITAP